MKKCNVCKTYSMMLFHTGECKECFDFAKERKRKLPLSDKEIEQRNIQGKIYYQRNKQKLAAKRYMTSVKRRKELAAAKELKEMA